MTSKRFSESSKKLGHGKTATHWTHESMLHCTCISGTFATDPILAAKEIFFIEQTDCDGNCMDYWEGEGLLEGNEIAVKVYGLVLIDGSYYWTKETKDIIFSLGIQVNI
jgi:hypothetical protein